MARSKKPTPPPGGAQAQPATVRVVFTRTYYPPSATKPFTIGQEVELPADEARGLASYAIVDIIGTPTRSIPQPPSSQPSSRDREPAEGRSDWRYVGGLLVLPPTKLIRQ